MADTGGSLVGELEAELSIETEHVVETRYLGTVRRMERLDKPDVCALILVDDSALDTGTSGFLSWETQDVTPVPFDVLDRIHRSTIYSTRTSVQV